MKIIKETPTFDFLGKRKISGIISIAALVLTTVLLLTRGLNLGVDFAGGTEIQVQFSEHVEAEVLREAMADLGFEQASVQEFGHRDANEYLVRVERISLLSPAEHEQILAGVKERFGEGVQVDPYDPDRGDIVDVRADRELDLDELREVAEEAELRVNDVRGVGRRDVFEYAIVLEGVSTRLSAELTDRIGEGAVDMRRVDYVGPQVGEELRTRGLLSLLYACIGILIYLAIRFDFRFAPGAIKAVVHDAYIIVGFYSLTGMEFNLTSIAALLTVIGYSVNDTVVVFDRIRESIQRFPGRNLPDLINLSTNEVLSRTIVTSGTTLLALSGLWLFAQGTIWDFAVAMSAGIIVGTYSTLFLSTPTILWMEQLIGKKAREIENAALPGDEPIAAAKS